MPPPTDVTLTTAEEIDIFLVITETASGLPAKFDGPPRWEIVSGNSTVHPTPDGINASVRSADTPGDTEIRITIDTDLSPDGVAPLSATLLVHVTPAPVPLPVDITLGISPGAIRPKSPLPPPAP